MKTVLLLCLATGLAVLPSQAGKASHKWITPPSGKAFCSAYEKWVGVYVSKTHQMPDEWSANERVFCNYHEMSDGPDA